MKLAAGSRRLHHKHSLIILAGSFGEDSRRVALAAAKEGQHATTAETAENFPHRRSAAIECPGRAIAATGSRGEAAAAAKKTWDAQIIPSVRLRFSGSRAQEDDVN